MYTSFKQSEGDESDPETTFQESWTLTYGFVQLQNFPNQAFCLLCRKDVECDLAIVQNHFEKKHQDSFDSSLEKLEAIRRANSREFIGQRKIFKSKPKKRVYVPENPLIEISYRIAQCITKWGKPVTDGEDLKETFLEISKSLYEDLPNKDEIMSRLRDVPLSEKIIVTCLRDMAGNISDKHCVALVKVPVFSVAVDINDKACLAIVAKYCDGGNIYEELCCIKPLQESTAEHIASSFIGYFDAKGIDVKKIFCVTSDQSLQIFDENGEFMKVFEDYIGRLTLKYRCLMPQDCFYVKISDSGLNSVMDTVDRILEFIYKSGINHGQFSSLLTEVKKIHPYTPLHNNVRWFSGGTVLKNFVSCLKEIKAFLLQKGENYPELTDDDWLLKLMFLTDISPHLNEINIFLQGERHPVSLSDLSECWESFTSKLVVFLWDICSETFNFFPHVRKLLNVPKNEMPLYMKQLAEEFSENCRDFQKLGSIFTYLINPEIFDVNTLDLSIFEWLNGEDFELQFVLFKSSSLWVTKFYELKRDLEMNWEDRTSMILKCWSSLPESFNCLKELAFGMLSAVGSTYMCKQIFSCMKTLFSSKNSSLTMDHIEAYVQVKLTSYVPDIQALSNREENDDELPCEELFVNYYFY